MEGRCAVETWAEFGFPGASCTPKITPCARGTDVFICTGSDEVYVFDTQERKLTAVLQFPGPVSDLVESHDTQLLYVSCTNGVYCVSFPCLLSRARSSPADASSCPAEVKISSESLLVGEESVSSLLLVGSVLLTLSRGDASWLLSLYKTAKEAQCSSPERLGSFGLPLAPAGDTEGTGMRRRPVLTCVHSGELKSQSSSSSTSSSADSSHFQLEPVLFKLLFGIEAALAKSPVVLCGLPDGRLCFLPLRLPGARLRVLHGLEEPVAFVGASVVKATCPGHAQCLAVVGEQGRVVLIKAVKGGPEGGGATAGFIEGAVAGPVVCGAVDEHRLYYSTGSDLLVLDLSVGPSGREGRAGDEDTSGPQRPDSLNVCRVMALAAPAHDPAGGVRLLGLSVRGQLQAIVLPAAERNDAALSQQPSPQVGRSVGDLLSAIGDVCERVSVLKNAIKDKNQTLKHLNQVLNVSFLLMASENSEERRPAQEKPIRCRAVTRWSRLLQEDSLNLTCVLDNSSPYVLEQGWTLSVTVVPVSHSPSAGEESCSANFSFPFHNLHPGETLEVSLPLATAGDTSFPMRVSCSLIFSLSSLLGEEEEAEEEACHLPGPQSGCISLPLNTLTVDWLHALRVNNPTTRPVNRHASTSQSNHFTTTDTVQSFLSSHWTRCLGRGGCGEKNAEREQRSARIRVSSELLRETLVGPRGPKLSSENLCVSLLDWLLPEHPGGGKVGQQGDGVALSSLSVHARGPNGDSVKLTAKEVHVGEEEHLSAVEVQLDSSSIAAVCGLHHAVLCRIQTLLQSAPERTASTVRVQSLGLRGALQRAERLLQQIQQRRISGAFGMGASTGQMSRSLLGVYQELRENPLLII